VKGANTVSDYTLKRRQQVNRKLDRRNEAARKRQERARRVLDKLKAGAILRKHREGARTIWQLIDKQAVEFVHFETVSDVLRDLHVVGVGDTLFGEARELSQTFRWCE
jgi:hypothetical protein